EPVLHITYEDAVLDENVAPRGHALVVHVEGAAPVGDGAVVDHRDELGGDLLSHASREGRGLLAVEISLEAVAHRLVEEDAGQARAEHHRHLAGGGVDRAEFHRPLPHRLGGEPPPALTLQEEVEGHPAAAAVGADLTFAVLLHDHRDVEAGGRPPAPPPPPRRRGGEGGPPPPLPAPAPPLT